MEALSIGVVYKTVVGSKGDLSPHTSQTMYFLQERC